jgi:hypothetical protein
MPLTDTISKTIENLGSEIKALVKKVGSDIWKILRMLGRLIYYKFVVVPYFFYWSYKTEIRSLLRYTALAIMTLSTLLLASEVLLELVGHESLLRRIHRLNLGIVAAVDRFRAAKPTLFAHLPATEVLVTTALLGFLAAVAIYLLFHNFEEARKPEYEYRFAKVVHSLLLDCRLAHHKGSQPVPILQALEVCHFIFRHAKVRQVSLHLLDDKVLRIHPEHIWPPAKDFRETALEIGEGLAGQIFNDPKLHIQYAPRLRWPINRSYLGWLFPHSVKLLFSQEPVPKISIKLWQVGSETINNNAFRRLGGDPVHYRSLLSVPVVSIATDEIMGVMNLDFLKTDAVDKADIEKAFGFALLLGSEIVSGGIAV